MAVIVMVVPDKVCEAAVLRIMLVDVIYTTVVPSVTGSPLTIPPTEMPVVLLVARSTMNKVEPNVVLPVTLAEAPTVKYVGASVGTGVGAMDGAALGIGVSAS